MSIASILFFSGVGSYCEIVSIRYLFVLQSTGEKVLPAVDEVGEGLFIAAGASLSKSMGDETHPPTHQTFLVRQ